MRVPTYTCKEVAQTLAEARERRLSLLERISLRIHLLLCGPCENYGKQMKFLDRVGRSAVEKTAPPGAGLDADARERIRGKLRR